MPTKAPRSDTAMHQTIGQLTIVHLGDDKEIKFLATNPFDADDCTAAVLTEDQALEALETLAAFLGRPLAKPDVEPGKDLFSTILAKKVEAAAKMVPDKRSDNIWFSEQIGVHPGAVSHYMQGTRCPGPEVYQQILKVLNWPAEEAEAALLAMEIKRTKANVRRVYGAVKP